jgi:hypothetical protein
MLRKFSFLLVTLVSSALLAAPKAAGPNPATGKSRFFLGSASDSSFIGSEVPGLSALLSFNDTCSLQFYLGIPTILPFAMGGGANFRVSVAGDNSRGLHIGGGLGLGAKNFGGARTFFVNVVPSLGVHFEIVDKVLMSFDSGATFSLMPSGTSNIEIILGGRSLALGLSVLYEL